MKISPFAPDVAAQLPEIGGVRLAACEAGIKYRGRKDLLLAILSENTTVAGVFTRSKTASAPVLWCRERLAGGVMRALVVNAGNANAFTGVRGHDAVALTARAAASEVGCDTGEVFVASTGVIGEPLDPSRFTHLLAGLAQDAASGTAAWHDAANAIMTTDTFPKLATRSVDLDGVPVTINGIAKGSGMIAPDMATMLAFVFTDAAVSPTLLQVMLHEAVNKSFNMITVDGDTSTSDTLLVAATGAATARGAEPISRSDSATASALWRGLEDVLSELARQVVMDGEGISKFVSISVAGAEDDRAAKVIAKSIANSPLVKTAIAGEDPNWGRVVMAVGKAGEAADRDRLSIRFGDIEVARNGEVAADYREELGAAYMKQPEIALHVDVGVGGGRAEVWTCDLTHDYISINADYRS